MTQQTEVQWSTTEKEIAAAALKKAYGSEVEALIKSIQQRVSLVTEPEDVWQLHDFLSASRHDIDGKYDNREDSLLYTLSRLVKDGWLEMTELQGLTADKRAKVNVLKRM